MTGFRLRRMALVVGGAACIVLGGATTAGAQDSPGRHALAGSVPAWTAAVAKSGDVSGAQAGIKAKVWLANRNDAEFEALAMAVSDPASAQYRQFISPAQYRARYAPTADQVAQVTRWLTSAGLRVTAVGPDHHFVAVSGSAAAIRAAFGTDLATYVVNGTTERAPTSEVTIPEALAGIVAHVSGLATLGHRVRPHDFGPPEAFVNGTPCSDYYGQQLATTLPKFRGKTLPWAVCGYTPVQLRGAYGVDPAKAAGAGATVAFTDAYDSPRLLSDANTYSVRHGDAPFADYQFSDRSVPEDPATEEDCGGNGWYGEQALDIGAIHAMAPAANVLYYGAASCFDDDLLAVLAQVVADNEASIVTNSWGSPTFVVIDGELILVEDPATIKAYESVFKQGAVQGIGFYFSSGDGGDELEAYGYAHPDYPSGDPWVTSVGGTSLAIDQNHARIFETGWGTSKYELSKSGKSWKQTVPFLYGSGGGYSQIFKRPWYQEGVVPANTTGRAVPDIGLVGDPTTGMLVGETQSFALASVFGPAGIQYGEFRLGGTSLSSPLLAGIQAVAQGSERIGFANPRIYHMAKQAARSSAGKKGHADPGPFYDVTPQGDAGNVRSDYVNTINADDGHIYSVRTFDDDSSLATGPGWDPVTGVGAPTARYIAEVLGAK